MTRASEAEREYIRSLPPVDPRVDEAIRKAQAALRELKQVLHEQPGTLARALSGRSGKH